MVINARKAFCFAFAMVMSFEVATSKTVEKEMQAVANQAATYTGNVYASSYANDSDTDIATRLTTIQHAFYTLGINVDLDIKMSTQALAEEILNGLGYLKLKVPSEILQMDIKQYSLVLVEIRQLLFGASALFESYSVGAMDDSDDDMDDADDDSTSSSRDATKPSSSTNSDWDSDEDTEPTRYNRRASLMPSEEEIARVRTREKDLTSYFGAPHNTN